MSAGGASATTITFNGLTSGNGAGVTTYTESGFTVSSTLGSWFQGQLVGNPVPSIGAGPEFDGPINDAITVTDGGGAFTFSALDAATFDANTVLTFSGTLHGATVFSVTDTVTPPQVFNTVSSGVSADIIDSLVITANIGATAANNNQLNIDNIVVTPTPATPLPATLPLFASGLGALGLLGWRRKRKAQAVA
jgi:hypothetical protein